MYPRRRQKPPSPFPASMNFLAFFKKRTQENSLSALPKMAAELFIYIPAAFASRPGRLPSRARTSPTWRGSPAGRRPRWEEGKGAEEGRGDGDRACAPQCACAPRRPSAVKFREGGESESRARGGERERKRREVGGGSERERERATPPPARSGRVNKTRNQTLPRAPSPSLPPFPSSPGGATPRRRCCCCCGGGGGAARASGQAGPRRA